MRKKHCFAANGAIEGVALKLEGCWALVVVQDEDEKLDMHKVGSERRTKKVWEQSYAIGLRSILGTNDMKEELMTKLSQALKPSKMLNSETVKDDKATSSVAWQVAKVLLMNAATIFVGVPGSTQAGFEKGMVPLGKAIWKKVTKEVRMVARQFADQAMKILGERIMKLLEPLELKEFRVLDVELRFVKVGDEDFTPVFSVLYKNTVDAKITFQVPGVLGIDGHIQRTMRYDISPVFSEIYHAVMDKKSAQLYKTCLGCFQQTSQVFCFHSVSPRNSKCQSDSSGCGSGYLPIGDTIDCARVDDNPEGG